MCFQTFATLLAQCIAQSKEENRARIYIEEVGPTSLLFPKTNCNFFDALSLQLVFIMSSF